MHLFHWDTPWSKLSILAINLIFIKSALCKLRILCTAKSLKGFESE